MQKEAKVLWGHTDAWKEFEQKNAHTDAEQAGRQLMDILASVGAMQTLSPDAPAVQEKIAALQNHITTHFYTCTGEILTSLGQMYVQDDRFRRNIDRAGGEGAAAFVSQAIASYCEQHK